MLKHVSTSLTYSFASENELLLYPDVRSCELSVDPHMLRLDIVVSRQRKKKFFSIPQLFESHGAGTAASPAARYKVVC